jgi:hypothetical protein
MLDVIEWLSVFQEDDLFSQTDQIVLDGVMLRVLLTSQFTCFSDPREDRFEQKAGAKKRSDGERTCSFGRCSANYPV